MFSISIKVVFVIAFFGMAFPSTTSAEKMLDQDQQNCLDTHIGNLRHIARSYVRRHPFFKHSVLGVPLEPRDWEPRDWEPRGVYWAPRAVAWDPAFANNVPVCSNHFPDRKELPQSGKDVKHLFPRMVLIGNKNNPAKVCGGMFVSKQFIATTAHCVKKLATPLNLIYSPGYEWSSQRDSYKAFVVRAYDPEMDSSDFALVKVNPPYTFFGKDPPCAPTHNEDIPEEDDKDKNKCVVFRWQQRKGAWELHHVLAEVNSARLKDIYVKNHLGKELATWEGPVLCEIQGRLFLVGLMSNAHQEKNCPFQIIHNPAVTRISYWLNWINTTIMKYSDK